MQTLKRVVCKLLVQVLLKANLIQDVVKGQETRFLLSKLVLVANAEKGVEIANDGS